MVESSSDAAAVLSLVATARNYDRLICREARRRIGPAFSKVKRIVSPGGPLPRTLPPHPHRSPACLAGGAGIFHRRLPRRPNQAEYRRSALGSGLAATTRVVGTTSVADTTASAGTARDTAPAAGTMGVKANREAPLPPTVHKRADFRSRRGSAPGGLIHWLRDRSTAKRACSERVAPGAVAAQRDGGYPVEQPRQEHRRAALKGLVPLAEPAPGRTPQPQTMRQ
jgi:hypothetical protein